MILSNHVDSLYTPVAEIWVNCEVYLDRITQYRTARADTTRPRANLEPEISELKRCNWLAYFIFKDFYVRLFGSNNTYAGSSYCDSYWMWIKFDLLILQKSST
jgi:hypothetical protein